MTSWIGFTSGASIYRRDDKRAVSEWWLSESAFGSPIILDLWTNEESDYGAGYVNPWWPYRGHLMGGFDGVPENQIQAVAHWYQEPWVRSGCNGRLAFVGYTRDQYGSPLGGCTVRCFRTSTDELVSKVTSDPNTGYYIATSPYADGHYLTVHKTLGPDVAGASVDTLLPG